MYSHWEPDRGNRRKALLDMLRGAVQKGTFQLASGVVSNFYVDARSVLLTPEGSFLAAYEFIELLAERGITAVGGPAIGACPIVSTIGAVAYMRGQMLKLFYVRSMEKEHGLKRTIEGPALVKEDRVLLVEDVVTTGASILNALSEVQKTGATVTSVVALVDRGDNKKDLPVPLSSIFHIGEILPNSNEGVGK